MAADWRALMVGSEGMLATIAKIWLRIRPMPEKVYTFLAEFKDMNAAIECLVELVRVPAIPVALELIDNNTVRLVEASPMAVGVEKDSWALLLEVDGPFELVDYYVKDVEEIFARHKVAKLRKTDDNSERAQCIRIAQRFPGFGGIPLFGGHIQQGQPITALSV